MEAARAGVPVVGIPLFGDQLMNAANLRHKGVCEILGVRELSTAEGGALLISAIEKVFYEIKMFSLFSKIVN
jgi:UDP:flavonoid glycosyltransferase YjiC (YdhE family)